MVTLQVQKWRRLVLQIWNVFIIFNRSIPKIIDQGLFWCKNDSSGYFWYKNKWGSLSYHRAKVSWSTSDREGINIQSHSLIPEPSPPFQLRRKVSFHYKVPRRSVFHVQTYCLTLSMLPSHHWFTTTSTTKE